MCQVDDGGVEALERKPSLGLGGRDCLKCGEKAVVVARIKDAFCRSCFQVYFTHRFRATFGKAKIIRDGDKVLFAFSGGQCSSAMVDLVKRGLDQSTHKKLRFVPALIYIDEGAVLGQAQEERAETSQRVCRAMEESGFPWVIASLEEALSITDSTTGFSGDEGARREGNAASAALSSKLAEVCLDERLSVDLQRLLASVTSLTAKQDIVRSLRNRLLVHKARQMGYCKVAMGDSGTRLSAGILADLAKGRGAAVPPAMAFSDDRAGDVTVLRPMREFTTKEIVMYNALFGVDSLSQATLATKAGEYASIDTLTEAFVNGLQANFPSTVSTVFRTGEKMCVMDEDGSTSRQRCSMCMSALDTSVGKSSALAATRFSIKMSRRDTDEPRPCPDSGTDRVSCSESPSSVCCGQGDGSCHSNREQSISAESLNSSLCYGCQVTLRDVKDPGLLPRFILQEAAKMDRRSKMRDEIKDFLLDGES